MQCIRLFLSGTMCIAIVYYRRDIFKNWFHKMHCVQRQPAMTAHNYSKHSMVPLVMVINETDSVHNGVQHYFMHNSYNVPKLAHGEKDVSENDFLFMIQICWCGTSNQRMRHL